MNIYMKLRPTKKKKFLNKTYKQIRTKQHDFIVKQVDQEYWKEDENDEK